LRGRKKVGLRDGVNGGAVIQAGERTREKTGLLGQKPNSNQIRGGTGKKKKTLGEGKEPYFLEERERKKKGRKSAMSMSRVWGRYKGFCLRGKRRPAPAKKNNQEKKKKRLSRPQKKRKNWLNSKKKFQGDEPAKTSLFPIPVEKGKRKKRKGCPGRALYRGRLGKREKKEASWPSAEL